jgi:hypothetical protein
MMIEIRNIKEEILNLLTDRPKDGSLRFGGKKEL